MPNLNLFSKVVSDEEGRLSFVNANSKAGDSITLRFEMEEAAALQCLNEWAGQPLPLNASAWWDGMLAVRLRGAQAAVQSAVQRLGGELIHAHSATPFWDDLRDRCPVAHGNAHGGVWMPTRHEDVSAIANDTEHFSSEGVIVSIFKPEGLAPMGYAPPITADPPFHMDSRRILLPAFGAPARPMRRRI